ncbi:MAG TPA: fumarylacetoacetate hydrolase family protein [Stellaceae bacterium]|nr:fumarylacetoacetate hydrolase family protein [Stellaceae bacterium]
MTPDQIERAASALVGARKGAAIASLPADALPQTEADSYQIQDAVIAKLGEKIGGWKVGISPLGGHFAAPIYASTVVPSPASLPAKNFKLIGIECEIGFRFNQALPARSAPYSRHDVLAVASLVPTIEVVDSRYQDFRSLDRLLVLADNFSNGGLVYGAPVSNWDGIDLAHPPIEVTVDGKPFADCTGLRAGTPIELLLAAVAHANGRGGIAAGTVITTGTHTGLVFTEPGVKIAADYGRLGRVEVTFPT